MVSADRKIDYAKLLGRVQTPILLVAAEGDIMSDVPSTELTYQGLGSPDKAIMLFGKRTATWRSTATATWSGAATRPGSLPADDRLAGSTPGPAVRPDRFPDDHLPADSRQDGSRKSAGMSGSRVVGVVLVESCWNAHRSGFLVAPTG